MLNNIHIGKLSLATVIGFLIPFLQAVANNLHVTWPTLLIAILNALGFGLTFSADPRLKTVRKK